MIHGPGSVTVGRKLMVFTSTRVTGEANVKWQARTVSQAGLLQQLASKTAVALRIRGLFARQLNAAAFNFQSPTKIRVVI